jgi:hypothetical protein
VQTVCIWTRGGEVDKVRGYRCMMSVIWRPTFWPRHCRQHFRMLKPPSLSGVPQPRIHYTMHITYQPEVRSTGTSCSLKENLLFGPCEQRIKRLLLQFPNPRNDPHRLRRLQVTDRISRRILSGSRPREFRGRYLHVMFVLRRNRLTKCTSSDS